MLNTTPVEPRDRIKSWIIDTFIYDRSTGLLTNKRTGRARKAANKAGYINIQCGPKGDRKNIAGHHIVWFLVYGCWPITELDHINRIKTDNRIENLREVDRSTNMKNRYSRYGKGVTIHKQTGKYQAQWRLPGADRQKYLGLFATVEEALETVMKYIDQELEQNE